MYGRLLALTRTRRIQPGSPRTQISHYLTGIITKMRITPDNLYSVIYIN